MGQAHHNSMTCANYYAWAHITLHKLSMWEENEVPRGEQRVSAKEC